MGRRRDWEAFVRARLVVPGIDPARARDIVAEVASQLEDVYLEGLRAGLDEDRAQRKATEHITDWDTFSCDLLGSERTRRRPRSDQWAEKASEAARAKGSPRWSAVADLIQDLRYSLRSLRANPGFSLVAILTLALGIGGIATMFTVFDQVLLRPLPYQDSEELVELWERMASFENAMVSYPNYQDWRDRNRAFEDLAAWNDASLNVLGSGEPIEIDVLRVSSSAFPLLRATPIHGRVFNAEEDRVGAPGAVILAYSFWRDHFGSDPSVVGTTLTFDDLPYTVVGIMGPGFHFPSREGAVDAYVPIEPLAENWMENRGSHPGILVLGRLSPGVTLDAAREDMDRIAAELETEFPDTNTGSGVHVAFLQARITRGAQEPLRLLLLAVGLLLAIASINVANLILARSTLREQEMAVRVSLGAGRGRVLRLLLTETVALWLIGGIAGVLIAAVSIDRLMDLMAGEIPPIFAPRLDLRAVAAVAGFCLGTGVLFGLPTALRVARKDLREYLKEGIRTTGGRGRARLRNSLVVAEVALAVALVAGAGLTLRSFSQVAGAHPGLDPEGVLTVEVNLPDLRYPEVSARTAFFTSLLEEVRALPRVAYVSTSYNLPLGPGGWQNGYHVEGDPPGVGGSQPFSEVNAVSSEYFSAMGIQLLRGRVFNPQDNADAPRVVIVDESMAERHWPGQDPIGKRLKWGGFESESPWMEVVGLATHVKVNGVVREALPQIYVPHWQDNDFGYYLVIKTQGDPMSLAEPVRRAVLAIDPTQPLASVQTLENYSRETTRNPRLLALLMTLFSAAAVSLAGVGIYGVMTQTALERRHEIGIRLALGARGEQVMGLVLRQGLAVVSVGIGIGLLLALAVGRIVSGLLFEVGPTDPLTFVLTPLLVAGLALTANLLPARRAMSVDPVRALQAEN